MPDRTTSPPPPHPPAGRRPPALAGLLAAAALAATLGLDAPVQSAAQDPRPAIAPATFDEATRKAADTIDAADLSGAIRFLADDRLEGRAPGSRGDDWTQHYLATTLESMGLRPGGPDGSWRQPFELVGIASQLPRTWVFQRPGAPEPLEFGALREFIAATGVQQETAQIKDAEVVFVGYGIQAPEFGWDDFKGVELKGKVLLMLNNDPDWDPKLFDGLRRLYYGRWTYKYESAARQGAAGAIIIHTRLSAGYPWQVVLTSWSGEQFELPAGDEPRVQVTGWLNQDAAMRLVGLAGHSYRELVTAARRRDFQPVPLGVTTSLTLANTLRRVETANVAGLLPGRDPALKNQVVVYTAHHDHLGMEPAPPEEALAEGEEPRDRIYNGARDNAAGVAQVLAIARAFTTLPERPRRSILFLFVAAEEQGLLGSKHYTAQPTFLPGRIAANLNFDGGNIWGPTHDVALVGFGKSSLDAVVSSVAAAQGRTAVGDDAPDKGSFYRSDQFSFARIGVPALLVRGGSSFVDQPPRFGREVVEAWIDTHYHQPSDELTADWKFDGLVADAQLGFLTGLLVAEAPRLPTWKPGDEFERARADALRGRRQATPPKP